MEDLFIIAITLLLTGLLALLFGIVLGIMEAGKKINRKRNTFKGK